jgi:hypothetical protein
MHDFMIHFKISERNNVIFSNTNEVHEEIRRRINSGKVYCYSFQKSFCMGVKPDVLLRLKHMTLYKVRSSFRTAGA